MHSRQTRCLSPVAAIAGWILFAHVDAASAGTLWVANNGDDALRCGAKAQPCRTINHALGLAENGDTIEVGPGLYGDLNNDGEFNAPGEEMLEGSDCLICIRKAVRIYAVEDAATTVIAVGGPRFQGTRPQAAVAISADQMEFGSVGHGFTVRGFAQYDVAVLGAKELTVAGNTAVGVASAAAAGVVQSTCFHLSLGTNRLTVTGNTAAGCLIGFDLVPASASGTVGPAYLISNSATGNTSTGFTIAATVATFDSNVATSNGQAGAAIAANDVQIKRSVFSGNNGSGLYVEGTRLTLLYSDIIGNVDAGIDFVGSDGPSPTPADKAISAAVHNNNIFGNDAAQMIGNCGIQNDTGSDGLIKATQNYWGAATGPGAEPADIAGSGVCAGNGGSVVSAPYATVGQ